VSFRAALVGLGCLALPLTPNAGGGAEPWQFGNLEQGYCITFLVSPEDAPGVLPDDAQPLRLDAMSDATPVLTRVLADQPEYAAWMPAAMCVYRFGRADIAGRELVAAPGTSEMMGIVAFGARVALGQPANALSVGMVFTSDKRAVTVTDSTAIPLHQVKATFGKAAHGDDERHVIEIGKTKVIWDGHAAADSAAAGGPVERVWVIKGPRSKPVLARWKLTAVTTRSMVGALVIEGKDKLAKLLRKSPIRYVGPMYQGGIAELTRISD
jgi:hypothetical protein